jgi:transcription initiation factor TFIID subunit 5
VLILVQSELKRLLWPIFIYSYLELVDSSTNDAAAFLQKFKWRFDRIHSDELGILETITLPQHVLENSLAKLYRENKYRLPMSSPVYFSVVTFLEANHKKGGSVIIYLLQTYCDVRESVRGPTDQYSFEAIVHRAQAQSKDALNEEELEGIPGAFTGVTNQDVMNNNAPLKLGPMQMESELAQDVRSELEEDDAKHPPGAGQLSLVEVFDQNIKREESAEAISRMEIPLPPSRARDVVMEVQKIKEYRDRFKIEGRTGGIGPGVSVIMFTFHNTLDT